MTYLKEQVNKDNGATTGLDGPLTDPRAETPGDLFRLLQKKYGRCVSVARVDTPDKEGKQIGWVFEKRETYSDAPDSFVQETWIFVHDQTKNLDAVLTHSPATLF
ncbi:hypothetical protein [Salinibacter phage M8CRM-1]|uniref:Uncharacterized protein n=1 Tax=Salinibacter phage M8CRM-1 TaxID=2681612 RepID=A0A2I6UGP6_9CAUD|nr:hypothetical protein FGG67_gp72 [Salinibacter phage M8CRM-1]AUO79159.1 hypothetical protein [Salinibacter phage M8CRM-1]